MKFDTGDLHKKSAGKPHILVKIGQYEVSNMKTYVDSSMNYFVPRHCEGNTVATWQHSAIL